jgi:hypothetical protein
MTELMAWIEKTSGPADHEHEGGLHYRAFAALAREELQAGHEAVSSRIAELITFIDRAIPLIATQVRAQARDRDSGEPYRKLYVLEVFRDLVERQWPDDVADQLAELLARYARDRYVDIDRYHDEGTLLEIAITQLNAHAATALIKMGASESRVPMKQVKGTTVQPGDFHGFMRSKFEAGHRMHDAVYGARMARSIAVAKDDLASEGLGTAAPEELAAAAPAAQPGVRRRGL